MWEGPVQQLLFIFSNPLLKQIRSLPVYLLPTPVWSRDTQYSISFIKPQTNKTADPGPEYTTVSQTHEDCAFTWARNTLTYHNEWKTEVQIVTSM